MAGCWWVDQLAPNHAATFTLIERGKLTGDGDRWKLIAGVTSVT